jgi:hypothetical protein
MLFGTTAFFGSTYFIYRGIKRKQIYDILIAKIQSGSVNIDNTKVNSVLNGTFHTTVDSSKPFIMLGESKIRELAQNIDNTIKGVFTDEEGVYASVDETKDKVALSQVASYYKAKYGKSLLAQAKDKLSTTELNRLYGIINSKPDVRWTKEKNL